MYVTVVDGTPELTYTNEHITDIYDKIYGIMKGENAYMVTDHAQYETMYDVFSEGRALFCDITLSKISTFLSDMDDDYGILPVPKYDTYQQEYLSFVNGASGFVMVAGNAADVEYVGTIMEAMAAYNYDNVTPLMFQVVTKLQVAQDPQSAAMVDYIIRNRIYDLAYYCDFEVSNLVLTKLESGTAEIASDLQSGSKRTQQQLSKLLKSFDKCD